MASALPFGAAEIVQARKAGQRPADMILVSLIGPLRGELNPVVVAQPARDYDWRFLFGLAATVVTTTNTQGARETLKAVEGAKPASLSVWFADKQGGVNLVIEGYRPLSKFGRRMFRDQIQDLHGLGNTGRSFTECAC